MYFIYLVSEWASLAPEQDARLSRDQNLIGPEAWKCPKNKTSFFELNFAKIVPQSKKEKRRQKTK